MLNEKGTVSVLIVSGNVKATDYVTGILPPEQFSPVTAADTAGEAKRLLIEKSFDIIAVNTPLPDEYGIQFAIDVAQNSDSGVILFCKAESFEQVSYKTEEYGIFTLARPTNRQMILQAVKMLTAARSRMKIYEQNAVSLETKMEEIRLVNRAKLLLIETLKMSESDAHRYIEKSAMDKCVKKTVIAENIIKTYE